MDKVEVMSIREDTEVMNEEEKTSNIKSSLKTEIGIEAPKKKLTWKDVDDDILKEEDNYDNDYDTLYEFKEGKIKHFENIKRDWELQDEINNSYKVSPLSTLVIGPLILGLRITSICFTLFLSILNMMFFGKVEIITSLLETFTNFNEVPIQQKKQAGMVFFFLMMFPLVSVSYLTSLFLLLFPLTTLPMFSYLVYMFNDKSPINGSRVAFLRYWKIWTYFVEYFPIRLVKTMNLDPSKRYLFCYHPHGIISFGAFGNFATDATGFSRLFPGINLRCATLDLNFKVPFLREYLLSLGICSCSKKACNTLLQRGPGSSLLLVVGGADESLLAKPGTYRLNVNSRKGFVRVAIDNEVDLVPVLAFGENDVFTTQVFDKGSFGRKLQDFFKKKFGFATPIFWGRDAANASNYGFLPHRTPIIAVVGKPVPCPKVPSYLKGDKLRSTVEGKKFVNDYHQEYVKSLTALYNAYKDKWAANRCESMMLVGRTNSKIATKVN